MDVLGPLLHLVLRSLVVLFPLTVGWLAFRRLALSKTGNAWIYAVMCLFAAVTAAGILPWTLGLTEINWFLLLLAFLCPALWITVICICDVSRTPRYGPDPLIDVARHMMRRSRPRLAPLILSQPELPQPTPVFRHRARAKTAPRNEPSRSTTTNAILKIARDIRGNRTSERRRPKLLPPPDSTELPFLNRGTRY